MIEPFEFEEDIPDAYTDRIWGTVAGVPWILFED